MTGLLAHAAETGGGPTGFGWASFVTFFVGMAGLTYMLGQFLKAVHARRTQEASDDSATSRGTDNSPDRTSSAAS
jgi:hypothetical protein